MDATTFDEPARLISTLPGERTPRGGAEDECAGERADALAAWRGRAIGPRHRVTGHVATGGMGHVFLVEHETLGVRAAAKVLLPGSSPRARALFEREAAVLAHLVHPNVVRVIDYGAMPEGGHYLLMEYLSGVDLASHLGAARALSPRRAIRILRQLASALDYLHARGIVHRDLKPANVIVDDGRHDAVTLVDFGIACRAGARDDGEPGESLAGTPAYMSPEQAQGEAVGPASDRYALGALALELLTGAPPFAYDAPLRLVMAAVAEEPELPSRRGLHVPGLDAIIERALAKAPRDRFASGAALVRAIEQVFAARDAGRRHVAA